ncbi:hypothetical protein BY996DRAFT_4613828 [Phakopsora pachyrhizi]|nr:hypothetical protein BY996DRAFT_4613828 [Phakopsora pachyrhizi]
MVDGAARTMDLPASGEVTEANCKEWNFDGSSTNQVRALAIKFFPVPGGQNIRIPRVA